MLIAFHGWWCRTRICLACRALDGTLIGENLLLTSLSVARAESNEKHASSTRCGCWSWFMCCECCYICLYWDEMHTTFSSLLDWCYDASQQILSTRALVSACLTGACWCELRHFSVRSGSKCACCCFRKIPHDRAGHARAMKTKIATQLSCKTLRLA